jgi:hypothetical protein
LSGLPVGGLGTFGAVLICLHRSEEKQANFAMIDRNGLPPAPYPAEKARGGDIILRTPLRRAIFIAGLAGAVVLALLLAFARFAQ